MDNREETLRDLKVDVLKLNAKKLKTEIEEAVTKLDCLCFKYESTLKELGRMDSLDDKIRKDYEMSIENISNTQKEFNSVEDVVESMTDTDRVWERMNKAREKANKEIEKKISEKKA